MLGTEAQQKEYRDAIVKAVGSYGDGLLARSQHESMLDNLGPLDAAANLLGWYYKGSARVAGAVGWESAEKQWDKVGDTALKTDPDKLLYNAASDFIKSLVDSCKKRWNEFWEDLRTKGLLVAYGKLQIDGAFLAAEVAIDVAIGLATEGVGAVAMRGIKIVAERISETATKVVIRAANRAARGVPRSGILKEVVIPDSAIDPKIKKAVMDEDLLGTLSHRQDMARRGEQVDPTVEKPDGKGASGGEKLDQKADGSYRSASDPPGVRRTASGEAMVQDTKTGNWTPVSQASNNAKGNFGEVMADRHMADQGYTKIDGPASQMGDKGHNGIDGVYRKDGDPPSYVIADAKYGSAGLGKLVDGRRQMSPSWVRERLGDAVGRREALAINRSGYKEEILHVDKNGTVTRKKISIEWRDNEK